jgi:magnesium-transporting ATPase (P-type)
MCRSVICCRVSPKQKSSVVTLAKSLGKWITLSVGDGANDVPMIMEAHIGVGIQGKEGTQAVRSADYALCQFRFLQRLILVHGRFGYLRISQFICYYFYKNIILVFAEIYWVLFNGFSGQIFFADFLPIMYNTLWTSWPCILAFCFEIDIIDNSDNKNIKANSLLKDNKTNNKGRQKYLGSNNLLGKYFEVLPALYNAGQIGYYFNLKKFWLWLFYAIIHGSLSSLCLVYLFYNKSALNDGKLYDHWYASTFIFSAVIHIVTYKMFLVINHWNKIVNIASVASIIFYYLCVLLISIPDVSKKYQNQLCYALFELFKNILFWIYILIIPIICLYIDLMIKYIFQFSKPNPLDLLTLDKIKLLPEEEEDEEIGDKRIKINLIKKLSIIKDPKDVYISRGKSKFFNRDIHLSGLVNEESINKNE